MSASSQDREDDAAGDSRRRADEFSALYEASRDLSAQTSVASLLRTLMERVMSHLGCASTSVFLYDTAAREVEVVATIGGTLPIGTRFGMNQGVPGRLAQTGQPVLVEDYQAWEHRIPRHEATGARAILMVPMTCGGELLGALGINEYTTERTYNEDDARLLALFATLAAGTLRTVQLLEEARGHSIELLRDNDERRRITAALRRSEERFRSLIEGMNDVVFTIGPDGLVTYISPAIERMTGHTPEETIGRPFAAFIYPEDLAELRASFRRVLEGHREPVEFRVPAKGGETRWVRSSSRQQFEGGVLIGITGSLTDITDRKRAEIALRESETRYRTLIELSPDGIGVHRNGEIVYTNSAGVRMIGATEAHEVIGKQILEYVHPDDRAALVERVQRMLETNEPVFHSEWRLVQLDGTVRDVEAVGMPLQFEGEGAIQVIVRDITDRKRAADALAESERRYRDALEQRVEERTAELAAANSELEAFGYSVSHDLRGPLRVIEGFSRMLSDEYGKVLDEAGRRYIDRVQANSQRMAQLIQDLLSLSRITRNAIERHPVDLSALATAVAEELRQSEPDRRVEFVIAPHATVSGDPSMLRILIENLLGNAWKYTGKHAAAHIEFGFRRYRGETTYFVKDDGAGFDMEFVGKLFHPFQRLHLASEFDGTGIGLATVERIVRRHGGRVWAEAAVERGATFSFTLSPGGTGGGKRSEDGADLGGTSSRSQALP